jgi:ABC-2 type transport system permease protein
MGPWLANVSRLGLKELSSLASDKVLVAFIVYLFSFSIYIHATGVNTEVANTPLAVVDSDRSALSGRIQDGLLKPRSRCCARAASGHAAAVPPSSVTKSRRLIRTPRWHGR